MKILHWYESVIWLVFGWMMKRRGYIYMDGLPGDDGNGVSAIVFSTVPIEREYTAGAEKP